MLPVAFQCYIHFQFSNISSLSYRYQPHDAPTYPTCGHHTKSFRCSVLTMQQCMNFHTSFYKNKDRQSQNSFILKFIKIKPVQRKRPKTATNKSKVIHTRFFVRKNESSGLVPVCQKAFLGILQIKRSRVDFISKKFHENGFLPHDNRGRDHTSAKFDEKNSQSSSSCHH